MSDEKESLADMEAKLNALASRRHELGVKLAELQARLSSFGPCCRTPERTKVVIEWENTRAAQKKIRAEIARLSPAIQHAKAKAASILLGIDSMNPDVLIGHARKVLGDVARSMDVVPKEMSDCLQMMREYIDAAHARIQELPEKTIVANGLTRRVCVPTTEAIPKEFVVLADFGSTPEGRWLVVTSRAIRSARDAQAAGLSPDTMSAILVRAIEDRRTKP